MAENEITADSIAENTPTQTLFRFVSLRSPQLSDEKNQEKRFILFPEAMKTDTVFYKPVTEGTGSKQKLLHERAEVFKTNADRIENLNDFKNEFNDLCMFASWLAVNKATCTYEEFQAKKTEILPPIYPTPELHVLWNNLIYQVVTQENFYLKETLLQMLLALHTLAVTDEDDVLLALAAKVVLPKELILDDNNITAITSGSRALSNEVVQTLPTDDMKKQQEISAAKTKLSRIELLNRNLSAIIKQYKKDYEIEIKIQKQAHQEMIIPLLEEYERAVAAAKQEYCSTRPPGTEYNPEDPCQQLPIVPFPRLPEFEFNFRDEVSAESLVTDLKPENLEALLDVLGYKFDPEREQSSRSVEENISDLESVLEGRDTFGEISTAVDKNVEELNNLIVQNFQGNEEVYKSIGGILIPVSKTVSVPFTFQICPNFIYKGYTLNLALNVPDSSWDVNLLSYALTPNGTPSSIDGGYFVKTRTGNTIFLNDLYNPGLDFYTIQDSTLRIKVVFTNGRVAEFTVPGITARACSSGDFVLQMEEGEPPVVIEDENNFIPSGFGFKNIGIADYLKVEQSTHAYVEGEVAHIENVMAREYREKSTRRLRRSENTTTTSSDTEREQLTDTTTANRFEMQSEISKMAQEASDNSTQFGVNAGYSKGGFYANASLGLSNAHHSSKEESTRQATTLAQDITSRAMDRIVSKVHEERIEKIIDEFEENNSHGLDNRKGDKHVVGVYRWVDKLMKNQIYNYGKRMMFEFMIPEPAKLHLLGMKEVKDPDQMDLIKPVDPRAEGGMQISDYSALNNEIKLKYWLGKYNAEIDEKPRELFSVTKAFAGRDSAFTGKDDGNIQVVNGNGEVIIPEGYIATSVEYVFNTWPHGFNGNHAAFMSIAGKSSSWITDAGSTQIDGTIDGLNVKDRLEFSFGTGESPIIQGALNITCELTVEARNAWLQKTFNAIINAYEDALTAYNNAKAEADNKAVVIKDSNPNFYRQIENTILRKNCISYMSDRTADSTRGYGLSGLTQGNSFNDYETVLSSKLDQYTAFVKFMEQAFEWDNLSYYLYPYYWGNKKNWIDLYQSENTDPLFRNFLQSGMARVIVTVRPGFEDAVQFYLATGKIWNGGEVPVIGDELYLSIVDEMKQPKGEKQGKAWLTRLPTTLNILQAESIGLKVAHALPFTTENPDDFEVPSEVITPEKFNFEKNNNLLGIQPGEEEKIITGDWL
ncbi:hypothetical protein [Chryseobacterium lineare]